MQPVRFVLVDIDYILEDDKPVVRLWGKTKSGESIVVFDHGFRPYFYVEPKISSGGAMEELRKYLQNLDIDGRKLEGISEVEKKFFGRPKNLLKLSFAIPSDMPRFRESIKQHENVRETYEHGISFIKRYMIERGFAPLDWLEVVGGEVRTELDVRLAYDAVEINPIPSTDKPELTIMAFDIETVVEGNEVKVIMVSYATNDGREGVITYGEMIEGLKIVKDEKELIKAFVDVVKEIDPDIITGYNTDRFDFQRLEERANSYFLPMRLGRDSTSMIITRRGRSPAALITGRLHIDIFSFVDNILSQALTTDILTLDMVASELIGEGKEKVSYLDIENLWKLKNVKRIAEYCLKDSQITLKLASALLPQIFELSRIVSQTSFDVSRMSYSQLVEWLLIKKAHEGGELVPNRPGYDEVIRRRKASPYIGGYVHTPTGGVHDNIALFDFQSLYPTITITHNISPETLDCGCCPGNKVPEEDYHFCSRHKGFIPNIIEELVNRRKELKEQSGRIGGRTREYKILDTRQNALKILANAIYGYYAYPGSRWYSRVCAQSIASWGRYYIKGVIELAQSQGLDVLYGDTDSLFLKVKSRRDVEEFLEKANSTLPGLMELDFREVYDSGIFVFSRTGAAAKKRYALLDGEGKIVVRGLERVRRDWAGVAKQAQDKVLSAVLKDGDPDKALRAVRRMINDLRKGRVELSDLIIYTQITRPLNEYEQIGPHVVAARKSMERGRPIREGLTVSYVITKGVGSISSRADTAEYAKDYDPEYYINNQVIPATLRILSTLGYKKEDLLDEEKTEQFSLDKYVKKKRFRII